MGEMVCSLTRAVLTSPGGAKTGNRVQSDGANGQGTRRWRKHREGRVTAQRMVAAWGGNAPWRHPAPLCPGQVKKALCVLIQHNLVRYQLQKRGCVEYEAQCRRVLRVLRYPRYIYTAKTLYGDTGELLVEELLLNGQMTMSAVVRKVADRLTETMEGGKLPPGAGSGRRRCQFCPADVGTGSTLGLVRSKNGP